MNWLIVEKNYELVQKNFVASLVHSMTEKNLFELVFCHGVIWSEPTWDDVNWCEPMQWELMWIFFCFESIIFLSCCEPMKQKKLFFELVQIIYFLVWCEMMWIDLTSTDLNIFEPVQISYFLSSILLINEAKKKRFWMVQNFFFCHEPVQILNFLCHGVVWCEQMWNNRNHCEPTRGELMWIFFWTSSIFFSAML